MSPHQPFVVALCSYAWSLALCPTLCRLDVKYSHDVREHAGEVLAAIARAHSSPLTASLTSKDYLQPLMERAFAPEQDHGLVQVGRPGVGHGF